MKRPRLLVFASGGSDPANGGSGFENLVRASRDRELEADIVGVVSNHPNGGVRRRAGRLEIPFHYFTSPWSPQRHQEIARQSEADFFALSGWLKHVVGLDPATSFSSRTVFNIHPGPLPDFGGNGMYGHRVHARVMAGFRRGEIRDTAVSMHFVTPGYDRGPVFHRHRIPIMKDDTPESLGRRVNEWEHRLQPQVTNWVVNGLIEWDGVNPDSLRMPDLIHRGC